MDHPLDYYLGAESPFLPKVEFSALNSILRDVSLEQGYWLGEAIAKALGVHRAFLGAQVLSRTSGQHTSNPQDAKDYLSGFSHPLDVLVLAYAGLAITADGKVIAEPQAVIQQGLLIPLEVTQK